MLYINIYLDYKLVIIDSKPIMNKLKQILINEKDSWILWVPVLFGIGVAIYFSADDYWNLKISGGVFTLSLLLIFLLYRINSSLKTLLITLAIVVSLISAGILSANLRTLNIDAPKITKDLGVKKIEGVVAEIHSRPHGNRFVLVNPHIEGLEKEKTPVKIRVNINTENGGARAGDRVSMLAVISALPRAVIPGGYDFSRYAYYEQIGSVGYAVSDVKIIKSREGFSLFDYIENLRRTIEARLLGDIDGEAGGIASAMLVGEKGGISKDTLENIRVAGIAHLLAISGMHLSLVAAIFFFVSRAILALIPPIAINYNIKKWAAYIAIGGSGFYLLISGAPISAQRAFLMTSLILFGVIIDRSGTPMRSVGLAALIILIFTPESILTPSFQMSFAAVVALIAAYEALLPFFKKYFEFGIMRKILLYILGMMVSSVVAGAATAPFALYHFSNFSTYGVVANLVAIPVTSFVIMPSGVMALLLMPFSAEWLPLYFMQWGINIITSMADYLAGLPQAVSDVPALPFLGLALVTMGGLWLMLWKTRWRLIGVVPIILAVATLFFIRVPDIIIDADGELFAVKDGDKMIFSSRSKSRYARERWQEKYGIAEAYLLGKTENDVIKCDSYGCIYKNKVAIARHPKAVIEDCSNVQLLINLTYFKPRCSTTTISYWDLKKHGTHVVYLKEKPQIEVSY